MVRLRKITSLIIVFLFCTTALAHAQTAQPVSAPTAGLTTAEIAGLYQMVDPRGVADPMTAATFLRLLPDGRSRLEAVMVSDVSGAITSRTEVGQYHRDPWAVRITPSSPELCFDVGSKLQCAQVEKDLATGDLLLFDTARPRGHADLRLHRIGLRQRTAAAN